MGFVQKPLLTLGAIGIIIFTIFYFNSQKVSIPDMEYMNAENAKSGSNLNDFVGSSNTEGDKIAENNLKENETSTSSKTDEKQMINSWPEPPNKAEKDANYIKAQNFIGIDGWINSEPLGIEGLRGKVVLIDFWTYSCINCIRTLPYLKSWDDKYRDKGLAIVGVHTPEFEFEKDYDNLLKEVEKHQLKYPIAQDNHYATWILYKNRYWPRKYLVDADGYIRFDHIGEGAYPETEQWIQALLNERMQRLNMSAKVSLEIIRPEEAAAVDFSKVGTPEIYLGYKFSRGNFGNSEGLKENEIINYEMPASLIDNYVYIEGRWKNNYDNVELISDEGRIMLKYAAKILNIVASSENSSNAEIYLDNKPLNDGNNGKDVTIANGEGISIIKDSMLYNIVSEQDYGNYLIEIKARGKGFKLYTFTFG